MTDLDDVLRAAIGSTRGGSAVQLLPLVSERLKSLAELHLQTATSGKILTAADLVQEVHWRALGTWLNDVHDSEARGEYYSAAAEAVRRLLVDGARGKGDQRGNRERVALSLATIPVGDVPAGILDLDDALDRLALEDPERADLVRLRFFGGLALGQVATVLGISSGKAHAGWASATNWLSAAADVDLTVDEGFEEWAEGRGAGGPTDEPTDGPTDEPTDGPGPDPEFDVTRPVAPSRPRGGKGLIIAALLAGIVGTSWALVRALDGWARAEQDAAQALLAAEVASVATRAAEAGELERATQAEKQASAGLQQARVNEQRAMAEVERITQLAEETHESLRQAQASEGRAAAEAGSATQRADEATAALQRAQAGERRAIAEAEGARLLADEAQALLRQARTGEERAVTEAERTRQIAEQEAAARLDAEAGEQRAIAEAAQALRLTEAESAARRRAESGEELARAEAHQATRLTEEAREAMRQAEARAEAALAEVARATRLAEEADEQRAGDEADQELQLVNAEADDREQQAVAETARVLTSLGLAYNDMGRFLAAVDVLETGLPKIREALGADDPWTSAATKGLAAAYAGLGRRQDGLRLYGEWLLLQTANAESADARGEALDIAARGLMTDDYAELRDVPRALRLAKRACAREQAAGGRDLWRYLQTLARAWFLTGEAAAAVRAQRRAMKLMPAGPDPESAACLAEYEAALARQREFVRR